MLFPGRKYSGSDWAYVQKLPFGAIPSLDAYIVSLYEHFRRNLQMSRKTKASDTTDRFHLAHLPYCDVFRADGDTSETARPLASAYKTKVVPKLQELPAQIESALRKRE